MCDAYAYMIMLCLYVLISSKIKLIIMPIIYNLYYTTCLLFTRISHSCDIN